MAKRLGLFGFVFLFNLSLVSLTFSQTESLTITTYYPSPFGSYRELRANQMAVGSGYQAAATVIPANSLIVEGNVGIGTETPSERIHIRGAGEQRQRIESTNNAAYTEYISGAGPTSQAYVGVRGGAGGYGGVGSDAEGLFINQLNNEPVQIATGNTVRMTIDSTGRVGIGTASPSVQLEVAGKIKVGNDANNNCNNSVAGALRYIAGTLSYCDGSTSTWKTIGGMISQSGSGFANACITSIGSNICGEAPYVDIVFPQPFAAVPNVIVTPLHLTEGATPGDCTEYGCAQDATNVYADNVTANGFRMRCGGSPSTSIGWTYGTCTWLAVVK
jgi:hypothetical protein